MHCCCNRNVSMIGQNRQRQNIQGARPQSDWIFSEKSPDCRFLFGHYSENQEIVLKALTYHGRRSNLHITRRDSQSVGIFYPVMFDHTSHYRRSNNRERLQQNMRLEEKWKRIYSD